MKSEQLREFMLEELYKILERDNDTPENLSHCRWLYAATDVEQCWVEDLRPYYNVWPAAVDLLKSVKLDLPMSAVAFPFSVLLVRFARSYEPLGISTARIMFDRLTGTFVIHADLMESDNSYYVQGEIDPNTTFESFLSSFKNKKLLHNDWESDRSEDHARSDLLIRLAVFISLLSQGEDLITRVVLAKDRKKYESTTDDEVRVWLEKRAERRLGIAHDFGKQLHLDRERNPHWRNPHFALFWTGKGREIPVIKMRKGSLIQKASMANVPTGYLGEEKW